MRGKVNSVSGDNIKFIEKEYDSATVYNEGDTALIRGVLYNCLVNNTTGTLNMDRWRRVYLSDLAEITSSEQALADMVDEVYDPSKTYNKSDTALYNEVLYICKNDGTTGKWNADLWEQTTLISILSSNLSKSNYFVTSDRSFKISKTTKKVLIIWWLNTDMLMEQLDLTNTLSWNRITIRNATSVIDSTYNNNNNWTYENDTITLLSLVNNGYKMFVIEL